MKYGLLDVLKYCIDFNVKLKKIWYVMDHSPNKDHLVGLLTTSFSSLHSGNIIRIKILSYKF